MSTFVLKKEYELQLPSSYVDIDREEMEYIDGGINISNGVISFAANMAFNAALGGGTIGSVRAVVRALGKQGSINVAKKVLTKWVSVRVANKVAGFLGGQIMSYLSFSVGDFIAKALDRYDGVENGVWTVFE